MTIAVCGSSCSAKGGGCELLASGCKPSRLLLASLAVACLSSVAFAGDAHRWPFNFAQSDHGFEPGFSDFTVGWDMSEEADWRPRPENLGAGPALYISGNNRSDNLFMFWKKKVGGLQPGEVYQLTFEVEFASPYPVGPAGVGVNKYLKVGATTVEPTRQDIEGYWWMNIDKGIQYHGGSDMINLGWIAKPIDGRLDNFHVLLTLSSHGREFVATADSQGDLWLIFGTESAWEVPSHLYYTRFTVWATAAVGSGLWAEPNRDGPSPRLVWNTGELQRSTDLLDWTSVEVEERPYIIPPHEGPVFWRISSTSPAALGLPVQASPK